MLRGNPPPPPPTSLFFLFLSISFPSLFKKKSENFGGGGFEPPEPPPPLKYALVGWDLVFLSSESVQALESMETPGVWNVILDGDLGPLAPDLLALPRTHLVSTL